MSICERDGKNKKDRGSERERDGGTEERGKRKKEKKGGNCILIWR